jgi:hypothetical protein
MIDLLWPVLLGLALAALLVRRPLPEHPPGDLLAFAPRRLPLPPLHLPWLSLPTSAGGGSAGSSCARAGRRACSAAGPSPAGC